jgi:hypothetical protein
MRVSGGDLRLFYLFFLGLSFPEMATVQINLEGAMVDMT